MTFNPNALGHDFKFKSVYASGGSPTGCLYTCSTCGSGIVLPLQGGETSDVSGPYPAWDERSTCEEILAEAKKREAERPAKEQAFRDECARLRAKFKKGYYWVRGEERPDIAYFDGEEIPAWHRVPNSEEISVSEDDVLSESPVEPPCMPPSTSSRASK